MLKWYVTHSAAYLADKGKAMPAGVSAATNLARLRLDRGWTQERLAMKAGLSRLALGRIERGVVVPRTATLRGLAKALDVPLDDLVTAVRPLESVRFRTKAQVRSRERILAEVSKWIEAYVWLEAELGEEAGFGFGVGRRTEGDSRPVTAARAARLAGGLAPDAAVRDICGLLETGGVKILPLETKRDSFFGFSVGQADGGPAIVVNTWDRISVERWIFTAAHELGHILLHPHEYRREATALPEDAEREADEFASEFLMPATAFEREWEAARGHSLLSRVLKVKRIFGVSYKTVLYRLVQAGRETSEVWQAFQSQHREHFGKTLHRADEPQALGKSEFAWSWPRSGEPAGLTRHDFMEDRLHRLVRLAVERGRISLGRAAEILGRDREDMRRLAAEWAK